nr:hypothetical protein Itr_chr08CG19280 [Ipomoea trifida]
MCLRGRKEFSVVTDLHDSSTPRVKTLNTPWAEPENSFAHSSPQPGFGWKDVRGREICCLVLRSRIVVSPFLLLNIQSLPSAKLEPNSSSKRRNSSAEHWRLVGWSLPWVSSVV